MSRGCRCGPLRITVPPAACMLPTLPLLARNYSGTERYALKPVEMFAQAGKVGPAYCTGVGKAMLAFLPDDEIERVIQNRGVKPTG